MTRIIMCVNDGKKMRRVLMELSLILLFSIRADAQGISSLVDPQTEVSEEDVQLEIVEMEGLLKLCGVAFGLNSENVHKAVVLDIVCPTEDPQLIKRVSEELLGNSKDDIKKACKDYLSDVETGKVKLDIDGSVLEIYCTCTCYQKAHVFSCLIGRSVADIKTELEFKQMELKGWIYDLAKGRILTLDDIFESEWLLKNETKINHDKVVFLNSDLNLLVDGSLKSPFVLKRLKKYLIPEFVSLIDWNTKPLFWTKADFDYHQLIKGVEIMNK